MSCPDFLYFCPMHLKKIALLNFKNISQEELALCRGINCLVGDNGAGKTNVVDAGLLPLDVQVVAADDRRAEHPPRRRLLPRRRDLCERCRQAGNHRVQLLAQGRQGAQAQRQGVRTAFGPRGTDPRGDRVAGRQRADLATPPTSADAISTPSSRSWTARYLGSP